MEQAAASGPWPRPGIPAPGLFKIAAVLTGFAACVGLMVFLIFLFQPPKPAAVVLVGADYATNLTVPHNVLGWKGLKGIEAVSKTPRPWAIFNPASLQLIQRPTTLGQPEQWDALIEDLSQSAQGQKTILFVLALHGGDDARGCVPDPRPDDLRHRRRLELKQVIESMKQCRPSRTRSSCSEGALVAADWRLGMLHNDFARRLQDLEPEIRKVKNLWVLSGCDVDQLCWTSEGLGRSAFVHYIIEALRGKAAGADGRLTLDELHDYVLKNVRNWAWNARGAIQEPVLLPRDGQAAGKEAAAAGRRSPAQVHLASVEAAPGPGRLPARGSCRAGRAMEALPRARSAGAPSLGLFAAPLARVSGDAWSAGRS